MSSGEELKYSLELFVSFRWQRQFLHLDSSCILDYFFTEDLGNVKDKDVFCSRMDSDVPWTYGHLHLRAGHWLVPGGEWTIDRSIEQKGLFCLVGIILCFVFAFGGGDLFFSLVLCSPHCFASE